MLVLARIGTGTVDVEWIRHILDIVFAILLGALPLKVFKDKLATDKVRRVENALLFIFTLEDRKVTTGSRTSSFTQPSHIAKLKDFLSVHIAFMLHAIYDFLEIVVRSLHKLFLPEGRKCPELLTTDKDALQSHELLANLDLRLDS